MSAALLAVLSGMLAIFLVLLELILGAIYRTDFITYGDKAPSTLLPRRVTGHFNNRGLIVVLLITSLVFQFLLTNLVVTDQILFIISVVLVLIGAVVAIDIAYCFRCIHLLKRLNKNGKFKSWYKRGR